MTEQQPTLEEIAEYCLDQQIEAGHVREQDRSDYLARIALSRYVPPEYVLQARSEQEGPPRLFLSDRAELMYLMSCEGWADQSSGDMHAPTGWFARISNAHNEIPGLVDAFNHDLELFRIRAESLIGHWLLRETSDGSIRVLRFDSEQEARDAYNDLHRRYGEWLEGQS